MDKAKGTLENERLNNPNLSADGRDATAKLQNVIQATQDHLQEKNADGKYQAFVAASKDAATNAASNVKDAANGANTDVLPSTALLKDLAFSGEFRDALLQAVKFLRDNVFAAGGGGGGLAGAAKQLASGASASDAANAVPAETQQQLWEQFSKIMSTLTSKPEFRDGLRGLWQFANDMSDPAADTAKSSLDHPQTKNAFYQARAILEGMQRYIYYL